MHMAVSIKITHNARVACQKNKTKVSALLYKSECRVRADRMRCDTVSRVNVRPTNPCTMPGGLSNSYYKITLVGISEDSCFLLGGGGKHASLPESSRRSVPIDRESMKTEMFTSVTASTDSATTAQNGLKCNSRALGVWLRWRDVLLTMRALCAVKRPKLLPMRACANMQIYTLHFYFTHFQCLYSITAGH